MNDRQITVQVETRTGLHVGSGYGDAVTDAFVRQDGEGRVVIPGTGLAGALRTLATRLAPRLDLPSERATCKALLPRKEQEKNKPCECVVCQLFGDVNPIDFRDPKEQVEIKARAGRLWVYDAYPLEGVSTWIRDGVGIERAAGVAHRQGCIKYDLEVLPPGTQFEVVLELEATHDPAERAVQECLLAAVLAEWAAGRGVIGGRSSRGLGALQLRGEAPILFRSVDLSQAEGLWTYLSLDDPWTQAQEDPAWYQRRLNEVQAAGGLAPEGTIKSWVRLTAKAKATGPFLVNDPVSAADSSYDHAPLLAGGDREKPLLAGSSIKGVLRSQAERIARTLATHWAWEAEKGDRGAQTDHFLRHCPACSPVMGDKDDPLTSCDTLLRGEQLDEPGPVLRSVDEAQDEHLCLACRLFGSTRRGGRLRVEDAPLLGKPDYKPQDFLAIDRFTGGGADQFKFDALVLWRPTFDVSIWLENPTPWELGWLLLVLRDVQDGWVTFGFGAAKGFGQLKAEQWQVEIGFLADTDGAVLKLPPGVEVQQEDLYQVVSIRPDLAMGWSETVEGWVKAFGRQAKDFVRDSSPQPKDLPALQRDSYFGTEAQKLYPIMEAHNE